MDFQQEGIYAEVCVHWMDVRDTEEYFGISNRPDAAILSYSVIYGEKADRESFIALLGAKASREELEYMSLNRQVGKDTTPIFLWQTEQTVLWKKKRKLILVFQITSG